MNISVSLRSMQHAAEFTFAVQKCGGSFMVFNTVVMLYVCWTKV